MNKLTDTFTLANGVEIPCIGFGTWQAPDGDVAESAVLAALEAGYRHIDTAAAYRNEKSVGNAVRKSGLDRKDVFVTSKLWNSKRGYDNAMFAFERTMKEFGFDYLDLYLLHWPAAAHQYDNWEEVNLDTWRAVTELYKAGRIRSIGVSNFKPHHLRALMETEVKPMVNQIEFHPGCLHAETTAFCAANGIVVEGYSPLGTGGVLGNETLGAIAAKYGKSVAQICIRWALQHNVLSLPKSVTPSRIAENADIFGFEISAEDMAVIDALENVGGPMFDSDNVTF